MSGKQAPAFDLLRRACNENVADVGERMRKVRRKDTKPERIVRSALHKCGYRFRLHRRDLPGCPDIVLPGRRIVIFVHGCFWHAHANCRRATRPRSNREFWQRKLDRNVARDRACEAALTAKSWRVIVIWECEVITVDHAIHMVNNLLGRRTRNDEPPICKY
jgi:DNA mismatch endonuclease (patch repair protein)